MPCELTTKVAVPGSVPFVKLAMRTAGAVGSVAFLSSTGKTSQVVVYDTPAEPRDLVDTVPWLVLGTVDVACTGKAQLQPPGSMIRAAGRCERCIQGDTVSHLRGEAGFGEV